MFGAFITIDTMWGIPVELLVTKVSVCCFAWSRALGSDLWLSLLELVITYLETSLTITTRKIHLLWIISSFSATFPSRGDILKCPVHIFLSKGIFFSLFFYLGLALKSTIYRLVHNPGSGMGPSWKEGWLARPSQGRAPRTCRAFCQALTVN